MTKKSPQRPFWNPQTSNQTTIRVHSRNSLTGALYTLKVTKAGYLSYTIKNLTLADWEDDEEIDIQQLTGDVNGDGIVNAVDLTFLLALSIICLYVTIVALTMPNNTNDTPQLTKSKNLK